MIILGIDPGTTRIGYGALEGGKKPRLIECGLLTITSKDPKERMREARAHFEKLLLAHKPGALAIEKIFFTNNQKTALQVAEMRGVLLLTAAEAGVPVREFAPTEIKMAVCGFGTADKKAVAKMACLALRVEKIAGPDDVTDAVAAALALSYQNVFLR